MSRIVECIQKIRENDKINADYKLEPLLPAYVVDGDLLEKLRSSPASRSAPI